MRLHHFNKRYELNVSLSQCTLLLHFNAKSEWTVSELEQATGQLDVKRNLDLLVDMGLLLRKEEQGPTVLVINESFTR